MPDFEDLPGPVFSARFNSICGDCSLPIEQGNRVHYVGDEVVHVSCPKPRTACTKCWLVHGIAQEDCDG